MKTEPNATHGGKARLVTLRQSGRVTSARLIALQVINDADEHLAVSEVHRRMLEWVPNVNISTVYRTLQRLDDLGLVHRLVPTGEARFGSAEHPHHHAECTRCGRILEIHEAISTALLSGLEDAVALRPDRSSGLPCEVSATTAEILSPSTCSTSAQPRSRSRTTTRLAERAGARPSARQPLVLRQRSSVGLHAAEPRRLRPTPDRCIRPCLVPKRHLPTI